MKYWLAADLEDRETIHHGQFDNLKIDTGELRVWLSRMTVADGMPYDNQVTVEFLRNGRWEIVEQYEG